MSDLVIDPKRTALVLMDFQPGIVAMWPGGEDRVKQAARAVAAMRTAGGTVAYVRVGFSDQDLAAMGETAGMRASAQARGSEIHADAPQTQYDSRLTPSAGEIAVRKVRVGAFSSTDLAQQLAARAVDTLLLAGLSTSGCVLSTVRDGFDRDFRQIVLEDACGDPDLETHSFLIAKIFPRQATIASVADLERALAG